MLASVRYRGARRPARRRERPDDRRCRARRRRCLGQGGRRGCGRLAARASCVGRSRGALGVSSARRAASGDPAVSPARAAVCSGRASRSAVQAGALHVLLGAGVVPDLLVGTSATARSTQAAVSLAVAVADRLTGAERTGWRRSPGERALRVHDTSPSLGRRNHGEGPGHEGTQGSEESAASRPTGVAGGLHAAGHAPGVLARTQRRGGRARTRRYRLSPALLEWSRARHDVAVALSRRVDARRLQDTWVRG